MVLKLVNHGKPLAPWNSMFGLNKEQMTTKIWTAFSCLQRIFDSRLVSNKKTVKPVNKKKFALVRYLTFSAALERFFTALHKSSE